MTSIKRKLQDAASNVLSIRDPNPNLPAIADQLEQDFSQFVPRYINDPAVIAKDADDTISRHISVSTAELRQLKTDLLDRTDCAVRMIDDLIRLVDNTMAEAAAKVRAEMERVNSKIAALKGE